MNLPEIVSPDEWLAARKRLLAEEKDFTRDRLNAERRLRGLRGLLVDNIGHPAHLHARDTSLVLVSRAPLPKLLAFQKRIGWTVPWYSSHNSDFNDDFPVTGDESVAPFEYNDRDQAELLAMGDDGTGEGHGHSAFLRDGTDFFHTSFTYARGADLLNSTNNYLDLTPLGRQQPWEEPPGRSWPPASGWWWRRHDEYETNESSRRTP